MCSCSDTLTKTFFMLCIKAVYKNYRNSAKPICFVVQREIWLNSVTLQWSCLLVLSVLFINISFVANNIGFAFRFNNHCSVLFVLLNPAVSCTVQLYVSKYHTDCCMVAHLRHHVMFQLHHNLISILS